MGEGSWYGSHHIWGKLNVRRYTDYGDGLIKGDWEIIGMKVKGKPQEESKKLSLARYWNG